MCRTVEQNTRGSRVVKNSPTCRSTGTTRADKKVDMEETETLYCENRIGCSSYRIARKRLFHSSTLLPRGRRASSHRALDLLNPTGGISFSDSLALIAPIYYSLFWLPTSSVNWLKQVRERRRNLSSILVSLSLLL